MRRKWWLEDVLRQTAKNAFNLTCLPYCKYCTLFFSIGGLILDTTVSDPNLVGIVVYTPVINGKTLKGLCATMCQLLHFSLRKVYYSKFLLCQVMSAVFI